MANHQYNVHQRQEQGNGDAETADFNVHQSDEEEEGSVDNDGNNNINNEQIDDHITDDDLDGDCTSSSTVAANLSSFDIIHQRPTVSMLLCDADESETRDKCDDIEHDELIEALVHDVLAQDEDNASWVDDPTNQSENKVTLSNLGYMKGEHNQLFYLQQHNERNGGIRGIVYRASNPKTVIDVGDMASEEDADLLFEITDNLVNKTKAEQRKCLSMIKKILSKFQTEPDTQVEIPTEMKLANRLCLENKNSIFNLLPYPPSTVIDGHACLDLDALLDHVLAMGTDLEFPQDHKGNVNEDGFNGTVAVKQLLERMKQNLCSDFVPEETAFGHLMFWSDGFSPFSSRVSGNSIWMLVVRVCPPLGSSTSESHNFCIAFGSSALDHDGVIDYYLDQLENIRKGKRRYYAREGVNCMINTCFDIVLIAGDTPEKRTFTHTANRGHYGKRSNHAGKIDRNKTPSCPQCYDRMVLRARYFEHHNDDTLSNGLPPHRLCNRCCNWDQLSNSLAQKFDKTQGTDYPSTCSTMELNPNRFPTGRTVNETCIVTIKQTFKILVDGMKAAYHEFVAGAWTKAKVRQYLQTFSIDGRTRERLIEVGVQQKRGATVNESDYIPVLWKKSINLGYELDMFPELGMHLLGHGIAASVLDLLQQVLTEAKLWTQYCEFTNTTIADIPTLDWCKVKKLPKANWLGEDLFGFQRVSLHLFGQFILNINEESQTTLFKAYLDDLKRLLSSCHVMICMLMCKKKIQKERLDTVIKLFLSCCHHFCVEYYDTSVTEFWFTKSNFLGLLNLPDQIEIYGELGYYWDGVFERAIQALKKILKLGFRKTPSSMNKKMILLQKYAAMDYIRKGFNLEEDEEKTQKRYQGGVKIYKNKSEIEVRFEQCRCLSGFTLPNKKDYIYVPYSSGRSLFKVVVYKYSAPSLGEDGLGMYNAKFEHVAMKSENTEFSKKNLQMNGGNECNTYCLMLPCRERGYYSIITHMWRELYVDGSMTLPYYSDILFSNNT